MAKKPVQAEDAFSNQARSIEQLLQAEQAVEDTLVQAKRAAAKLVSDAHGEAQAIDKRTSERIAKLARECAEGNARRIAEIDAKVEAIENLPVDTQDMQAAIAQATGKLAARLTGDGD